MRRSEWWPTLLGFAEDQGGLVTAAQARQAGATRPQLLRLVESGVLDRLQHGIYQLSGSPIDRWTDIRAAWLAIAPDQTAADRLASDDPQGVVSHRSAALLLNLGDVDADQIEFTTNGRRRTRNSAVKIHYGHLERSDWDVREGLPVTTPDKTVQMLATAGMDLGHLAGIVRDSVLRYDIPLNTLERALDAPAKKYGYRDGRSLLQSLLQTARVPTSTVDLATTAAAERLREKLAESEEIQQLAKRITENMEAVITPAVSEALMASALGQMQNPVPSALREAMAPVLAQVQNPMSSALREAMASMPDPVPSALREAMAPVLAQVQNPMPPAVRDAIAALQDRPELLSSAVQEAVRTQAESD
jgi:hypothetical protein